MVNKIRKYIKEDQLLMKEKLKKNQNMRSKRRKDFNNQNNNNNNNYRLILHKKYIKLININVQNLTKMYLCHLIKDMDFIINNLIK